MEENHLKSTITISDCSPHEARVAQQKFPFQSHHLEDALKYMGFWIKPHCYMIVNWIWLVVKITKQLLNWNHRFLSRVAMLVLIQSVLEATPIY